VTHTSEWPYVTRDECWRVYRPAQPFSESAFQRLRSQGFVSEGFRLHVRSAGHLSGQLRVYSRLNLLALDAYRCEVTGLARDLAERAAAVEGTDAFAEVVRAMLLAGLPDPAAPPPRSFLSGGHGRRPWLDRLADVCLRTDEWQVETPGLRTRLLAKVKALRSRDADLAIRNQSVIYDRAKLARIGCDERGAKLWLYWLDLGGADELIRARPAIDIGRSDVPVHRGRGLYGSRPARLTAAQRAALDAAVASGDARVPAAGLSGLRVVR
jgi:hypothetical protein